MIHIVKVPLRVSPKEYKILKARFNAAHSLDNAVKGEGLHRLTRYRSSPEFVKGKDLLKSNNNCTKELDNEISGLFSIARTKSGYYLRSASKYGKDDSLQQYAYKYVRKSWIADHLDSTSCITIADRVFASLETKRKNWKNGKVRFKSKINPVRSIRGKENSCLKWKNHQLVWNTKLHELTLNPGMDLTKDEKYKSILKDPKIVKYVTIIRKMINGVWKYSAIITCEGSPIVKSKHKLGKGEIGIDLGTSTFGYVADKYAKLSLLCQEIDVNEDKIKKLQRVISRQQRLNNSDKYEPDFYDKFGRKKKGKVKKGAKNFEASKRQQVNYDKLAELKRKQAEYRRCLHGKEANEIRSHGNYLKIENTQKKGWQKLWGKSVGNRAPAMFETILKNKFLATNGKVLEINTFVNKGSQRCPNCGNIFKKELKDRLHQCDKCGYTMQREMASSIIAKATDDTSVVNARKAKKLCKDKDPVLRAALKRLTQSSSDEQLRNHFGLKKSELEKIACENGVKIGDGACF